MEPEYAALRTGFYRGKISMNIVQRNTARRRRLAFTLQELCVIAAILILLVCVLGAAYTKKRQEQVRSSCAQNLKNVGLAIRIWSAASLNGFPTEYSTNESGT